MPCSAMYLAIVPPPPSFDLAQLGALPRILRREHAANAPDIFGAASEASACPRTGDCQDDAVAHACRMEDS